MVLASRTAVERILVAGTGSIGRRHIANLQRLRPHASWGLLRESAREDAFSASLDARVFGSLSQALDWGPQLAVIATPSDRHAPVLAELLNAKVACYIEKPVVVTAPELLHVRDQCKQAPPPTQVGCVLRFVPSLRQVHQWLQDGLIGRVVRSSFEVGQWLPDWRPSQDYRLSYSADAKRGGGVVLDLVHEVDLACWLFNRPKLLGAWGGQVSGLDIHAEDVALLSMRAASGALISVQLDYVSRQPVRRLHVVGDAGSILWDLPGRQCLLRRPGETDLQAEGFDTGGSYVQAMEELLNAIETGTPTSLPLTEGLPATAMAIEANAMIRRGVRS